MKANMGSIDRTVRISVAVILWLFIFTGMISGVAATVFGIIALVLLITGIFSRCMLYYPLGITTCKSIPAKRMEKKESDTKVEE